MKAVGLLACLVIFSCCLHSTFAENEGSILGRLIKIVILYIEYVIHMSDDSLFLENQHFTFNNTDILEGTLSMDKLNLYGLNGLVVKPDLVTFDLDFYNKYLLVGFNISIPNKVGVEVTNYEADIGLINYAPIYGNGSGFFQLHSINVDISANIMWKDGTLNLTLFEFRPFLSAMKFNVTGFWKNEEFSDALTLAVTGLLDLLVVIWDFEIDCFTCVIGLIVQNLVNKHSVFDNLNLTCAAKCSSSNNSFIQDSFNNNNPDWINMSQSNIINYIGLGLEFLYEQVENYL